MKGVLFDISPGRVAHHRLEDAGIIQRAPEQGFPVAFDDAPMSDNNSVEISGQDCSHRCAKRRAIFYAKSEDAAHPGVALDPHDVAMEEVIPGGFVSGEVEDQIRNDQGPSWDMKEEMLLEPWQPRQRKDFEVARPLGRRG
jgi:hypothetical protein